ncbi:unnamed protein product [Tuwongella immobilis]|uniref:Uncharacterized protein n=1 Tax=Tuwongella immobilis TaxID=692036 RepID=A0A6C2YMP8_9BACT|nr:unnamed protein product [Tuwongella immobilis]VTS01265.1 unnamed protein product [Tuwongella immobilis]
MHRSPESIQQIRDALRIDLFVRFHLMISVGMNPGRLPDCQVEYSKNTHISPEIRLFIPQVDRILPIMRFAQDEDLG